MRTVLVALVLALAGPAAAVECSVAPVLFGSISLEPVRDGAEVLLKEDSMEPGHAFGALRGTIVASREGLIVLNRNGQRVALVERASGRVVGEDAGCSRTLRLLPASSTITVIANGDTPVGTIKGKLPR